MKITKKEPNRNSRKSLNSLRKTEITQSILFNHNGMILEISKRRKTGKLTNMWKLNTTLNQPMGQKRNHKEN